MITVSVNITDKTIHPQVTHHLLSDCKIYTRAARLNENARKRNIMPRIFYQFKIPCILFRKNYPFFVVKAIDIFFMQPHAIEFHTNQGVQGNGKLRGKHAGDIQRACFLTIIRFTLQRIRLEVEKLVATVFRQSSLSH